MHKYKIVLSGILLWSISACTFYQPGQTSACKRPGLLLDLNLEDNYKICSVKARAGDVEAQFYLAFMYDFGLGVMDDDIEAIKWYRTAAEMGQVNAQHKLGYKYHQGKGGLRKDITKAIFWYRKAAEQGYATAQNNLGTIYDHGNGVPEDDKHAVKWYQKAAERGNQKAQYNLGFMYHYGNGIAKNTENAIIWYEKAANSGHLNALNNLAWGYATCEFKCNGELAVKYGQQLVALSDNPGYLDTLAAAYARNGQFNKAVETQKKAIDSLPNGKKKSRFQTRLKLYENKIAYREWSA